jgi:RNA polymerase sigma-70 factor (ECF subfamily)
MSAGQTSQKIQGCLDRLRRGDAAARDDLIAAACARLRTLTRRMFRDYPGVKRWEEPDDVMQDASIRLCKALRDVMPQTPSEFMGLAALQIRRQLIDLARRYSGPEGLGTRRDSNAKPNSFDDAAAPHAHAADSTYRPDRLAIWGEFHRCVEALPEEARVVFDLLWYQEVSQAEAAEMLGVSLATLKRRWQSARRRLFDMVGGELPF